MGTAQLAGNLVLLDYTPIVGNSFTVVTASVIEDHFDTIPAGMVKTDYPDHVTVTQVEPPPGD